MDIVTQGLLGGVLAQTVAGQNEKKLASFIGVFAGLLADADILIRSADDPLLNIEFHRHFSHSLLFVPFGAAIAMLLLWPFVHRHITITRLYLFCLLGYSLSGVLDAFTSYGTLLFWPFSDERIAWRLISIIDPVFTLIILITFIAGLRLKVKKIAYVGLSFAIAYMGLGYFQIQRAESLASELIQSRNHLAVRQIVKPTLGNNILWRSVYIYDDRIYVDAVRVSLFSKNTIYEGSSVPLFKVEKVLPGLSTDSILRKDIQRFASFSDNYVAMSISQKNVLGDLRYSMLANSTKPLWGIIIDETKPQQHAEYRFFRNRDQAVRKTFINMLLGRCAAVECPPN
ncbi:Integral membrane protein [hydrothermal vent metagenome]|uniref:Integral membrane protein n=1 Tax=hydrothermal vent metagenome TaxID=652676 RepID=A0A3B0ZYN0_9ZZZZ